MGKKVIKIDEDRCIGCGLCENACQQSAIKVIDGKARVVEESFCDGLGRCLPVCPVDAIDFAYEEESSMGKENKSVEEKKFEFAGCPGKNAKTIERKRDEVAAMNMGGAISRLNQWPVQIKLVPENAPYFDGAKLLVAADCSAFAYGNFHDEFLKGRIVLIGCPKLDEGDYTDKLTAILKANDIKSLTVVRMEVPCCGGIENAAINALKKSLKFIPWQVVTISIDGEILDI